MDFRWLRFDDGVEGAGRQMKGDEICVSLFDDETESFLVRREFFDRRRRRSCATVASKEKKS